MQPDAMDWMGNEHSWRCEMRLITKCLIASTIIIILRQAMSNCCTNNETQSSKCEAANAAPNNRIEYVYEMNNWRMCVLGWRRGARHPNRFPNHLIMLRIYHLLCVFDAVIFYRLLKCLCCRCVRAAASYHQ